MGIANYFQFNVFSQPDPHNPQNTVMQIQPGVHGLFSGGLVMDILIGIDEVTARSYQTELNQPIATPVVAKALFDTGCTITSIDHSIITSLGLKTRGYTQTATANGEMRVSQHLVSLSFPGVNLKNKPLHTVQSVNLEGQPFKVLIGRDLMASWTITYNGPAGFVSIAD